MHTHPIYFDVICQCNVYRNFDNCHFRDTRSDELSDWRGMLSLNFVA